MVPPIFSLLTIYAGRVPCARPYDVEVLDMEAPSFLLPFPFVVVVHIHDGEEPQPPLVAEVGRTTQHVVFEERGRNT